ncbi:MAG TPA: cysteine synthase family protein [Tepidisphaeraceae bacterium]|jgi:cysteine synthase A|nr:cysteine synthase family protein [Tepidisphaeraceae bacterium]
MNSRPHAASILSLVGNTPMIPLRFEPEGITVHAKCEFMNPSGSVKDRFAVAVITDALRRGALNQDSIILECTSGNTGISLASVGAAMGIRVAILMSKSASVERRQIMRHLGAELILFDANAGYRTGIDISREMAANDSRYFLPSQFDNPLNSEDHEHSTALEILRQAPAPIDCFVAGYGTGATLAGMGRALKKHCREISIFAMEPAEAAMLAGECPCCHAIEGVAGGFLPPLLSAAPLDGAVKISSAEALGMARRLSREFGLLVGTSSGANVAAALKKAAELPVGAVVVTILCDRAERYFSTRLFDSAAD